MLTKIQSETKLPFSPFMNVCAVHISPRKQNNCEYMQLICLIYYNNKKNPNELLKKSLLMPSFSSPTCLLSRDRK